MTQSPFVVTISGDPLAGKSSGIKEILKEYEQRGFTIGENPDGKCIIKLAAGQMFREIARKSGISEDIDNAVSELTKFAHMEGNTLQQLMERSNNKAFFENLTQEQLKKSVDNFVDDYMLAEIEKYQEKYQGKKDVIIIVDSRVAGLLMNKQGKDNMAVRFSIQSEIAAQRLLKDAPNRPEEINIEGLSEEEAYKKALGEVSFRTNSERERFKKTYGVEILDTDNYDLVINTSGTTIKHVGDALYKCIELARAGKEYEPNWRSTKYIYPGLVEDKNHASKGDFMVGVVKVEGQYYAIYGQDTVGCGNQNGYGIEKQNGSEDGYPLIPVEVIATGNEVVMSEGIMGHIKLERAEDYVKCITRDVVEKFEKAYGFKYPESGVRQLEKGTREGPTLG